MRIGSPGDVADPGALDAFIPALVTAVQTGDVDFLTVHLHPAAEAFYGAEACQAYFEGLDDPTFNLEPLNATGPDTWYWERDGLTASVPLVYTVEANVTAGNQTTRSETHFGLINGEFHWFPDCGEPLP